MTLADHFGFDGPGYRTLPDFDDDSFVRDITENERKDRARHFDTGQFDVSANRKTVPVKTYAKTPIPAFAFEKMILEIVSAAALSVSAVAIALMIWGATNENAGFLTLGFFVAVVASAVGLAGLRLNRALSGNDK